MLTGSAPVSPAQAAGLALAVQSKGNLSYPHRHCNKIVKTKTPARLKSVDNITILNYIC